MTDLDFDELDKAVASAMGTPSPANQPSAAGDEVVNVSTPASVNASAGLAIGERQSLGAKPSGFNSTPAPASPTPPAKRRTGRFMDMIHPSSDMKTFGASVPAKPFAARPQDSSSKLPSHPQDLLEPGEPTKLIEEHEPAMAAVKEIAAASAAQDMPMTPIWPDPLDFHDAKNSTQDQPQQSPFLANANVSKRPLGAFAEQQSQPQPDVQATTDSQDDVNNTQQNIDQQPANNQPQPTQSQVANEQQEQLPSSLHSDVVLAEEAEVAPAAMEPQESAAAEMPLPTPQSQLAAASITPQYPEPSMDSDVETHPIFDTSNYHKPIDPAAGKKHGTLLWVLLIIGLVVTGAGIGAAWFFVGS